MRFIVASAAGHKDYVRFIVYAHARTGSNMLLSMLNSHPLVLARGEVFARVDPGDLHASVERTFDRRLPRAIRAAGCKVFYYHPLGDRSGALWRELDAVTNLHVIHLRRRNVLRTVVSREIADRQNDWLQTRAQQAVPAELKRVSMTAEQVRAAVERVQRLEEEAASRFVTAPLIDVYYEDLVADGTEEFGRITRFLRVPFYAPKTGTFRQNPEPLSGLLDNYEELRSAFEGTPFSGFFDG
jgi:LPS sulfotransferase NodH